MLTLEVLTVLVILILRVIILELLCEVCQKKVDSVCKRLIMADASKSGEFDFENQYYGYE